LLGARDQVDHIINQVRRAFSGMASSEWRRTEQSGHRIAAGDALQLSF
jgi:hypothetical protein